MYASIANNHSTYPLPRATPHPCTTRSALHVATSSLVGEAQSNIVKILLSAGADPNCIDNDGGNTPLHIAVSQGSVATVQLLLDAQANVNIRNQRGLTPIFYALYAEALTGTAAPFTYSHGSYRLRESTGVDDAAVAADVRDDGAYGEVCSLLLKTRAVDLSVQNANGDTPLHLCLQRGRFDVLAKLLECDSRFGRGRSAEEALNQPNVLTLTNKSGQTPLIVACLGIECEEKAMRPYSLDAMTPSLRCVELLLSHGDCDIDRPYSHNRQPPIYNYGHQIQRSYPVTTVLYRAIERGHTLLLNLCLQHGAKMHLDSSL